MKNVLHIHGFVFLIEVIVFFLPPLCHHHCGCMNSLIGTLRSDNGDASENVVEK